jgi:hypothetical protein
LTKLNTATMLMEKYLLVKEDAYGMTCVTRTINLQIKNQQINHALRDTKPPSYSN